jgi:nucleoside-diphosphate-sugar epimerase
VDDLVSVLAFALLEPAPPPLLLAVDDEPAPRRQVLEWLASQLGAPLPQPRDPAASATRARRSDSNKRVSNALLRSLGVSLRYPTFREGYGALLKAAR